MGQGGRGTGNHWVTMIHRNRRNRRINGVGCVDHRRKERQAVWGTIASIVAHIMLQRRVDHRGASIIRRRGGSSSRQGVC